MKRYETVFIATPVLSEPQLAELVSKFQSLIAENGGKIEHTEQWGLKKLAYPIAKKSTGFYFMLEFTADNGNIINALETGYRRDERVIRFLTFNLDADAQAWAEKRRQKMSNSQL